MNKAAKQNIPSGRIQNVLNAVPTETTKLMEERDRIRSEDPADDRIKILNSQINQSIKDHRKEKWLDHLKSCGPGTKKLWDTIKSLNNHPKQPGNQVSNSVKSTTMTPRKLQINSIRSTPRAQKQTPPRNSEDSCARSGKNPSPRI